MGSSVSFYGIVGLWITFRSKMSTTTTPPRILRFLGIVCGCIYAAFCSAILFVWYLCRLKPQDISPNSKITPSILLRRNRL